MNTSAIDTDRLSRDDVRQAMLAAGTISSDAVLARLTYEPIGIGAMADTFRVALAWEKPGQGPASLVAKLPATDAQTVRTAVSLGAYEREAQFYEVLAPHTNLSLPKFYGILTYDGQRTGLLLEDLSARATPGDQLSEADVETVVRARQQLVALQTPFWNDAATQQIDWLHKRLGVPIPGIIERMERSWSTARDRIAGDFDQAEREMIDRFVDGAGGWAESLDGPFSLTHHDFRFDNLMFDGANVIVLDWQTVGWGVPMFDVAYLLGTSVGPERRAEMERDEIHRHVDELAARGVDWSFDDAWTRYRQAAFAALLMLVPPTGSVKQSARSDAMYRRLLRSGARMALDLQADDFLGKAS